MILIQSMMKNPTRFFCSLLFLLSPWFLFTEILVMAEKTAFIPVNVGVVLDLETITVGKMGLSCIELALSDFYHSHSHYKTRLVLHTRDSNKDVVGAAAAALDLLENVKVQAIIGPETSMQADFVIHIGDKAQVPIISFSATSTFLSSIRSPYFIRATQNDSFQVKAISALIQSFGWRRVVPIYEDNEFGESIIPYLTDALQEIDARIPYRSVISPSASDDQIGQELYKLMTMQTRVFIVHMLPSLGSRLFLKAEEIGMMSEGYIWIVTDGLGNLLSSMDSSVIDSMQGVLGLETYISRTKELKYFTARLKRKFQQDYPSIINADLNIFGLRAYDAAVALAMAVEKVGATDFGIQKMNISGNNSMDLETLEVSKIGHKLPEALSSIRFKGLGGDFHIINGQLQSSTFQIFNVFGNKGRGVGYWTSEKGISSELNLTNRKGYNTCSTNLRKIIWPGKSTSIPKGWVIPIKGKKLKIGVPVKKGFEKFIKMTTDKSTNTSNFSGYCIDVFKAVMEALPYNVPYELISFQNSDGESAGTYNELVYQVYLQKYDAVAGDVTIIANRSNYVDFTLPYTESGVSMIVPIKDKQKNAWVFLKPLTWELWVTSSCFFVFIGFVIWVLEHRINEDFRGPPSNQVGMIFWFSFSTMVFAHRERVLSNLSRFVAIVWVFVVLILTQSYTASLTSMLTVEKLQPAFTDVNDLINRGEYVGYLKDSFVFDLLKRMRFNESKLREYNSLEECHELLSKRKENGSIAAVFDEVPYMRQFLEKYGSKYTMVDLGPSYKTDGFGFVFPKGSPLVPDVSRAILKVKESEEMETIWKTWFSQRVIYQDPLTAVSSNSLGVDSFWGLFLIAAVAASLALIIYAAMFLYEHRHILTPFEEASASLWRKIKVMLRHFDKKDLNFHTFKKSEALDKRVMSLMDGMGVVEASSPTSYPSPTPSSMSNQTDGEFAFFVEQGSPSTEHGDPSPNRQTPQEIVSAIELTDPNRSERSVAPEIAYSNN